MAPLRVSDGGGADDGRADAGRANDAGSEAGGRDAGEGKGSAGDKRTDFRPDLEQVLRIGSGDVAVRSTLEVTRADQLVDRLLRSDEFCHHAQTTMTRGEREQVISAIVNIRREAEARVENWRREQPQVSEDHEPRDPASVAQRMSDERERERLREFFNEFRHHPPPEPGVRPVPTRPLGR